MVSQRQGFSSLLLVLAATVILSFLPGNPPLIEASSLSAGASRAFDPDPPTKRTHLYELQLLTVELESSEVMEEPSNRSGVTCFW